ncbi:hypothetical protein EDD35_0911 [Amycolatopsis thermoflava]|uniref:Uncharacterized protein n=1 Tax=Amycolatopsis thermoflava TaxID=84480 RepID=A0A3N2GPS0_9PSEU|nr:hypothetical protein EDD35_0911 [Amycolatopsis thermoflava]
MVAAPGAGQAGGVKQEPEPHPSPAGEQPGDHDLEVVEAILEVVARHGAGPYPVDDLASLTGLDADEVWRVMEQLVEAGLATRHGPAA